MSNTNNNQNTAENMAAEFFDVTTTVSSASMPFEAEMKFSPELEELFNFIAEEFYNAEK
jgi:hypothetical protein